MAATVEFPFAVKKNEDGSTAFVETSFRFTIKTARELEKSAGQGIAYLVARGQSVESLVLLTFQEFDALTKEFQHRLRASAEKEQREFERLAL
jgi:hypothetical protein